MGLVPHHFEDGIDGLLLGGVDERAGVDDDDVGVFGAGGDFSPVGGEHAHHDLGVHEVLGTTEADKADARTRRGRGGISVLFGGRGTAVDGHS